MDNIDSIPNPITIVAVAMILTGAAGLAGGLSRDAGLVVLLLLLAVASFLAGRMSSDLF